MERKTDLFVDVVPTYAFLPSKDVVGWVDIAFNRGHDCPAFVHRPGRDAWR